MDGGTGRRVGGTGDIRAPNKGGDRREGVSVQSVSYSPVVPGGRGGRCHLGDPEHPVKGEDSAPRRWDGPHVVTWEHICVPPRAVPSTHRGAFGALLAQGTLRGRERRRGTPAGHAVTPRPPVSPPWGWGSPCPSTPPRGGEDAQEPPGEPPGTGRHSPRAQGGRGGRWGRWGQPDPADRDSVTPMSPRPSSVLPQS